LTLLPDVVGLPVAEANDRCRRAGFRIVLRHTGPPWPQRAVANPPEQVVRVLLLAADEVELTVAAIGPERDRVIAPPHLAIICDGNGRWAAARGLDRLAGHRAGSETFRRVAEWCAELGVQYLSLYVFSTENWRRPKAEVEGLMRLIVEGAQAALASVAKSGFRVRVLGRLDMLPGPVREAVDRMTAATSAAQGMTVNLLLNYGGRSDILEACRSLMRMALTGRLEPEDLSEELLSAQLATAGQPDPDLIIRTAGDLRLSNFLVWQSAYSELHFTPVHWPDFRRSDLLAAFADYARRQRRFGGLEPEEE